jgi:hypothetical protein
VVVVVTASKEKEDVDVGRRTKKNIRKGERKKLDSLPKKKKNSTNPFLGTIRSKPFLCFNPRVKYV